METTETNYLTPEQLENGLVHENLDRVELDKLLTNFVHENENMDTLMNFFLQYLPGNRKMQDFIDGIREYNNAQICGLVWNANVIAYRCKTCSISPCMSICAHCFQHGNHEGHNYNMFKSQAGGACDCGDSSVMHEFGFCRFHGENRPVMREPPRHLTCCAEFLIPHLLRVFVRALRISTVSGDFITEQKLLEILNQLSNAGSAVQIYITRALTDQTLYTEFKTDHLMTRLYHHEYTLAEHEQLPPTYFVESLTSDTGSGGAVSFDIELRTLLDEIMMWCVTARLPEELVRFLLSLLPDLNFKLQFTETFLRFYGIIAYFLSEESHADTSDIPSRLVHISVQLFSSHMIAEYAMEHYHLIEVILSCIWRMFVQSMEPERIEDEMDDENILKIHPLALIDDSNSGMVVNVEHHLIVKNVYWPLLSDFVNILSQEKIALKIMEHKKYFHLWLRFLTLFQGMNVNERILNQHIEYEPQAYMYAFTIELEISAAAMWCLVNHLKSNQSPEKLIGAIQSIIDSINDWTRSLHFHSDQIDPWKLTFHLPLHRYLSVFAYHAIYQFNANPTRFLPVNDENVLFNIMFFPLRTLSGYFEVLSNIWLRNGQQLIIQAKTYAKSAFSSSMHDADLFLLQLISCYINPDKFVRELLNRFHVYSWLFESNRNLPLEPNQQIAMLESSLIALCAIVGFHPNIAVRDTKQIRTEIVTTLAVADRLYSEVEENVPDPTPLSANRREIDTILEQVSDFQTPSVELLGQLQQGKYAIKNSVFLNEYDPLHVIMRCTKRANFQNSLERFTNLVKHDGVFKSEHPIWPPFRIPEYDHPEMSHVQRILRSKVLHQFLYLCLNGYLKDKSITQNILYFAIYLLELAIRHGEEDPSMNVDASSAFTTDNIFTNLCTPLTIDSNETERETLISLLFKVLQKQCQNDFYQLMNQFSLQRQTTERQYSRIGDAFHFITNIFYSSSQLSEQCRILIEREIEKIKSEFQQRQPVATKTSDLTVEQKKQRAKNRQQKLLAEIAQSQKKFISQQNPNDHPMLLGTPPSLTNDEGSFDQAMSISTASNNPYFTEQFTNYECCVCRTCKSDSESPIGLIGTSCLSLLPSFKTAQLDDCQQRVLSNPTTSISLEIFLNRTKQSLIQISGHPYIADYCQNDHHLRSLLIQSCGHSIHSDCLSSYLKALHPNQEAAEASNTVIPTNTNFRCPLCRQSANTLIPLFNSTDYLSTQDPSYSLSPLEQLQQAMMRPSRPKLKREVDERCLLAFLSSLAAKCVSTEQVSPNSPIALPNHQSMKQRAAEFDCGTLRAQLVHEQLFYESANKIDQKNIRKSFYKILHDLHHLGYPFHHQHLWRELTGLPCPTTIPDVFDPHQPLAPVLLRDSITMLLQLLMSAPNNLTIDQFDIIIQVIFNVEFFKNLIAIIIERAVEMKDLQNLHIDMHLWINYIREAGLEEDPIHRRPMESAIEHQLMNNFMEFFKITSLIKYRLYSKEMPWVTGEEPTALALANFLNLKLNLNGLAMPHWFCSEPRILMTNWFENFRLSAQHHRQATKILSIERPHFHPPSFINLPSKYDDVFHLYNESRCEICKKISPDTLLCLICGEVHIKHWQSLGCLHQRQRYVRHLAKCGHPAAVMLDIQTTLILVCLGESFGYWHSLYLDQHGEEDPKLKRGKTLYLDVKRLGVLRTLWLTATYDYQIHNWATYNHLLANDFDVLL